MNLNPSTENNNGGHNFFMINKDKKMSVILYDRESFRQKHGIKFIWKSLRECSNYIKRETHWKIVRSYFDIKKWQIGLSFLKNRCMRRKIDLVVVYSISHLSGNISDVITIVRELKSMNTGVLFIKEQLCTLDSNADLIFSFVSLFAEEELRLKSHTSRHSIENIHFKPGHYSLYNKPKS